MLTDNFFEAEADSEKRVKPAYISLNSVLTGLLMLIVWIGFVPYAFILEVGMGTDGFHEVNTSEPLREFGYDLYGNYESSESDVTFEELFDSMKSFSFVWFIVLVVVAFVKVVVSRLDREYFFYVY